MEQTLITKMASWMPWAKGRVRDEDDDIGDIGLEEPNLLLSLLHPDVTSIVLDYLDPKSLLSLRLVNKRTKWWIDSGKFLSRLRITLHSNAGSKRMRKILRSKTDFCNFRLGYEKRNNEELVMEFAQRFGPTLKVLDINTIATQTTLITLLSNCPILETLTLLGINLSNPPSNPNENEGNLLGKLTKVLGNLKMLSIGSILFVDEEEMKYFRTLLLHCTSLLSLRLPYVNFQSKRPKELRDGILAKFVLDPVIEVMEKRGQSLSKRNLKYLILEYLNPLSPQIFLKIAKVCYKYQTILHNVHESHLKRTELFRTGTDYTNFYAVQEIIGTLDGLNENVLLGRLTNLKCISIWVSSAQQLTGRNYEGALLPKLNNINLYVDSVEEDPSISRLLNTVMGTCKRSSVESLKISYSSRKGAISADLVKAIDISKNFEFLKKLDIYQWDAFDEEFLVLWGGLGNKRIQDLSLLLCTNLSDKGLLGWDQKKAAILQLTGLKELHISSLYGSITDVTIHRALRHMPLTKLRLYSQSVTYDGIASLLDGVFYTTIDYIHCSKPLDCTQKEFYYLVKDIMNAKSCPDFPKRRQLRRRSQPFMFLSSEPSDEDEDQDQ